MKSKMFPFAFSKVEVKIARAVSNHKGLSIRELSTLIGKSEGVTSKAVKSLEKKGVIQTIRHGMEKLVYISDRNYAISLQEMFKAEPYVPWEELISYSNIEILFRKITGEQSFENGISSVSSWRTIRNLSLHGMLDSSPKVQSAGNRRLSQFINEYSDHVSREYLIGVLPEDAIILWRSGYRCLFKIKGIADEEAKKLPVDTFPTALTAFPYYGLRFISSDLYYYHEPNLERLTIEDILLHTLLVDQKSQTYATYALLLTLKNKKHVDLDLLLDKSVNYHLKEEVENFIKYIKSHGKRREWPLPKPSEFREQSNLYGVVFA